MANRPSTNLPRAPIDKDFVGPSPAVWNLVMDCLEYAMRIAVAPPLTISDSPIGKIIRFSGSTGGGSGTITDRGQNVGDVLIMTATNAPPSWGPPFAYEAL